MKSEKKVTESNFNRISRPIKQIQTHLATIKATFGHNALFKVYSNVRLPDTASEGKQARVLIDCGASLDFISTKMVAELMLKTVQHNQDLDVELPNGEHMVSRRTTAIVEVIICNYARAIECTVIDLKKYDVILGRPWLANENPNLNWRSNQV